MSLLLSLSSFGFLGCSIYAFYNNNIVHGTGMAVTFITSEAFHITRHPLAKRIDMTFNHIFATITLFQSLYDKNFIPLYCILLGSFAYWFFRLSTINTFNHFIFVHVPTFIGSISISRHMKLI